MSSPCPPVDSCACNAHCCVADAEAHYGATFDNKAAVWLDQSTKGSLSGRTAMEIYNDGSADFQYSTNAAFTYVAGGAGRTVKPNTGVALAVGPNIRHYFLCSGGSCSVHITELGNTSV